jgi:hypothetical protein
MQEEKKASRKAYHKQWIKDNPEKAKGYQQRYRDANKQYMSDRQRKYHLKNQYGITEVDYDLMFLAQAGQCAICKTDTPTGKWKRFAVDHCHHTGLIRGLLCNECNRGMGLLKDNAELLRVAANYLESNNERK